MSTAVARVSRINAGPMGTRVVAVAALLLFASSTRAHAQLFEPEIQIDAGVRPKVVAIGDLNSDGKFDLVVGNAGPSKFVNPGVFVDSCYVSAILGNGDGTFNARVGYRLGNSQVPSQVVISDLNGDDRPDLVVPVRDPVLGIQTIQIKLGNGDGTFQATSFVNIGGVSIAVAKLNNDEHPDLVIASEAGFATNSVSVCLGNGDGTFGPGTAFTTGATPKAVVIADFNDDDLLDLATSNNSAGTLSILLGNGDGTFAPKTDYPTGTAPWAIAVGDLNRDGRPDLAVQFLTYVAVHYNLGGGAFGPAYAYAADGSAAGVAIANFDFDLWPDLAVVKSSGTTAVWRGTGPDSFGPKDDFIPGGGSVAVGDLNGDFEPDIATTLESANALSILFNVPDQVVGVSHPRSGGGGFDLVAPNPARDLSQIEYTVVQSGTVRLEVTDVAGRVVATLFHGVQPAGQHHASWSGTVGNERVPAGLYFLQLTTPSGAFARKLMRIR